jgi:uncharacterized protein YijF (DUF1287 family)
MAVRLWIALTLALAATPAAALQCLVDASRTQIGVTLHYDPSYARLPYPGGDVPIERGVCTDVVIRAYRAIGVDLQQLVHEDMRAHFSKYPNHWGLRSTDRNIDHRRVPNLARYFARHGEALGTASTDADFLPGDLVTWRLPSGVPHIGIVSDRTSAGGTPLIVHNIGAGAREEDVLRAFEVTGHYRFQPSPLPELCTSTDTR